MSFRDREKKRVVALKPELFSKDAGATQGVYSRNKKPYDFCLHNPHADENLHESFRADAIAYFEKRGIHWHDGVSTAWPSNHLCCSQSGCINAWYPYTSDPANLKQVLTRLGYPVEDVLPIELDDPLPGGGKPYVAFEWIGQTNYLREGPGGRPTPDSRRTRGANATSSDFLFRFRRTDGTIQIVLGEWKYTEVYSRGSSKAAGKSGATRLKVYSPFLDASDSPFVAGIDKLAYFYEPCYQLMRMHLLAREMEKAREMNADLVTIMHVGPKANRELMNRNTSPDLDGRADDLHSTWATVLKDPDIFTGVHTEDLLPLLTTHAPDPGWADWMHLRYGGMK